MASDDAKKLDVYLLERELGRGGMGVVYEARHSVIGKKCAIKVLHDVLEDNEQLLKRMLLEAKAASAIGHPNIVEVYDFRKAPDGPHYMVMELLDGESLEDLLDKEGRLAVQQAAVVLSHVLSALAAAHDRGIVHRDLKPENIFLAREVDGGSRAKILDFGITKFLRPQDEDESIRLTQTGMVLGSPYYMSPEQASGERDLDARTDLWSCGVIFYEMLTGTVPFDGDSYNRVLANILTKPPTPVTDLEPGLPRAAVEFLDRALEKERGQRFQTAQEMLQALLPLLPSEPVSVGSHRVAPAFPSGEHGTTRSSSRQDGGKSEPSESEDQEPVQAPTRPGRRIWFAAVSALVLVGILATALLVARGPIREPHRKRSPSTAVVRPDASVDASGPGHRPADAASPRSSPAPDAEPSPDNEEPAGRKPRPRTPPDEMARKARRVQPARIRVRLVGLPAGSALWLDSTRVRPPVYVPRDGKQHCIEVIKKGYRRWLRCFQADRDRILHVRLKKKPRDVFDSPY